MASTSVPHCISECKHGRSDKGEMIRCCLCAVWYHEDCLGLQEHDRGVWPCPSCRKLNSRVEDLSQNMGTLIKMITDIKAILTTTNAKDEEEKARLLSENATLVKENMDMRKTNSELNIKVNSLTWKNFRNCGQRSHVLIGSSIVRDVDEDKLIDTEVICKRGGSVSDVKAAVEELNPGYDSMTLIVRGNDCEAKPAKSIETILKSYDDLIVAAKEKSQIVRVSSICPRLTS